MFKIWDEDEVEVSCNADDASLVQGLMKDALKEVKDRAQNECNETLSMNATFNRKAAKISGGVIVTARGGNRVRQLTRSSSEDRHEEGTSCHPCTIIHSGTFGFY